MPDSGTSRFSIDYWNMPSSDYPLYPFCVEEIIRDSPVRFQSRGDSFFMLVQIFSGRLRYSFEDSECVLSAGDAMFVPGGMPYRFESYSCGGCYHKFTVEFKGFSYERFPEILRLPLCKVLPDRTSALVPIGEEIRILLRKSDPETIPALLGRSSELLTLAVRDPEERAPEPELLTRAKTLLIRESSSVPEIAEELGMSAVQLGRLFHRFAGMSPQEYRIARRMATAEHLLRTTPFSIKEIAYQLGYCNPYHFANEFRRLKGCSPTAFRKTFF